MTLASFSVWRASTSLCSGHRAAIDLQFTNVVIFRGAIFCLVFPAGAVKIVSVPCSYCNKFHTSILRFDRRCFTMAHGTAWCWFGPLQRAEFCVLCVGAEMPSQQIMGAVIVGLKAIRPDHFHPRLHSLGVCFGFFLVVFAVALLLVSISNLHEATSSYIICS